MNTVVLSKKHELVIPRAICDSAGLQAGASFEVFFYNGRIELIPLKPIQALFGTLKGIDTTITREEDRI